MILTYFTARSILEILSLTLNVFETIAAWDLKLGRCRQQMKSINVWAAPVAEWLRELFLITLSSHRCLVWVRAPLWPHVRQAKFCLRVYQVFFLGVLPFSPHLLIGSILFLIRDFIRNNRNVCFIGVEF